MCNTAVPVEREIRDSQHDNDFEGAGLQDQSKHGTDGSGNCQPEEERIHFQSFSLH